MEFNNPSVIIYCAEFSVLVVVLKIVCKLLILITVQIVQCVIAFCCVHLSVNSEECRK